jgi:heterotetrameric sarcosine oxidase gamma subunit
VSETPATSARWRLSLGMASVAVRRGGAPELARVLHEHAGLAPPEPGRWVGDDTLALVWSAPGQFLVAGDPEATQRLAEALHGHALVIDLSGGRVVVRVSGMSARDVLARCVPLDLHPRAMRPGHAASTIAAHIGVQIWQIDAAPTYDIAGPASYAASLRRALEQSGARFEDVS